MFELLRKFSLLMILFVVALSTYLSGASTTDWRRPLLVKVYPISGDGLPKTASYIEQLSSDDFVGIEEFMSREAERFRVDINQPVNVELGSQLPEVPPVPPLGANPLSVGFWSLQIRWWAHNATKNVDDIDPDIKLFLVYFDPVAKPALAHSVGLRKGLLGIVNVFSDQAQATTNHFVITHEMLHTLGASDKYGGPDNLPIHPVGYADPNRSPRYPQSEAEIMGGRIPLSPSEAVIPEDLWRVRVGAETALEIRWLK
jgi:hypothetical protein